MVLKTFCLGWTLAFATIGGLAHAQTAQPNVDAVVAALPPLDGMRLTAFQAAIFTRTQQKLIALNPGRIMLIEELLATHGMCFRRVATASVTERYFDVVAQLSGQERTEVLIHLKRPTAAKLLAFYEGTSPRLELSAEDVSQLRAEGRAVGRFHELVRTRLRGIRLTESGPDCQQAMARDFASRGLAFVTPIKASPGDI
jgi:hypothetical protein